MSESPLITKEQAPPASTIESDSGMLMPPIRKTLVAGMDTGGTKVHIIDT